MIAVSILIKLYKALPSFTSDL